MAKLFIESNSFFGKEIFTGKETEKKSDCHQGELSAVTFYFLPKKCYF